MGPHQIVIKNLQKKLSIYPRLIKSVVEEILFSEKVSQQCCLTICFVDDSCIRIFNKKYLGHDYSTDVISFSFKDGKKAGQLVADVMVSADTALSNSVIFRTNYRYELCLYAAHGFLHSLGYDDKTLAGRRRMDEKAKRILLKLRIK